MAKKVDGEIKKRITNAGFKITKEKKFTMSDALLRDHYAHLVHKPFWGELTEFMTSGPCIGLIVEGKNAVARMREIIGVTDSRLAAPGTIRKDYGVDNMVNVMHGSDSPENAEIEIKRFFGGK